MSDVDSLAAIADVVQMTRQAKSTLRLWIRQGLFPPPIKCGGSSRWSVAEVQAWIAARKAEREAQHSARAAVEAKRGARGRFTKASERSAGGAA